MIRVESMQLGWCAHVREESLGDGSLVFIATHPDFPGVIGQGTSYFAAEQEFDAMLAELIEHMVSNGIELPRSKDLIFTANITPNEAVAFAPSTGGLLNRPVDVLLQPTVG